MRQLNIRNDQYSNVNSLMWRVIRQLSKGKKQILDQFELTSSQFEILSAICQLSTNMEEVIQINLSEKTQIDPMTTSTILRNLEKRNLITRMRGLINTRTVIVRITDKGEKIYKEAFSKIIEATELIYQNTNEKVLASQLLIISDKLNKLNS